MKKMAKRFFSSVIVLAMLMALLPATVSQAAALVSTSFETQSQLFTSKLYASNADTRANAKISWDETTAYSGNASMKFVQGDKFVIVAAPMKSFSYGKTYRVSARVKIDNPSNASKTLNFETYGDKAVLSSTKISWGSTSLATDALRVRSSTATITDSEWHLLSREFTLTNLDNGATKSASIQIGIETQNSQDTIWIDDFSIVEVDKRLNISFDFEDASQVNSMNRGSYECYGTYTHDTTQAYSGAGSLKSVQKKSYTLTGALAKLESGKTYRATAMVKVENPVVGSTKLGFELWSYGSIEITATNFKKADANTNWRWRNSDYFASINDSEWYKITQDFTFNIPDTTKTSVNVLVGIYTTGGTHTLYVDDYSIVDVEAISPKADFPEIGMDVADWKYSNAGATPATLDGEENALFVTKSAGYGVLYQNVKLNNGQKYLLNAKFYVPVGQVGTNTKIDLFVVDGEKTIIAGEASHTMTNNPDYGEAKYTKVLTAEDEGKWISVALPFTFKKPSYDTDDTYRVKALVNNLKNNKNGYYLADVEFVDTNIVNIDNIVIEANGTVTYTANKVDYIINYQYLDGTSVLASGKIYAGEFLPKFNLAGVEEPTVKLTATNAYGEKEETVVGILEKEDVPEVQEGEVVVKSVSINEDAQDIADVEDGMFVSIKYTNSTEEAKQVWVMVAFYNENGLMQVEKYDDIILPVSIEEDTVEVPEDDDIVFVEGATVVKAFVWDVNSAEPLCAGYTVE